MWYINTTRDLAREILEQNGYKIIDQLVWVKSKPSIGKYFKH